MFFVKDKVSVRCALSLVIEQLVGHFGICFDVTKLNHVRCIGQFFLELFVSLFLIVGVIFFLVVGGVIVDYAIVIVFFVNLNSVIAKSAKFTWFYYTGSIWLFNRLTSTSSYSTSSLSNLSAHERMLNVSSSRPTT